MKKLLIAALLTNALPVQATVVYHFTSAPIYADIQQNTTNYEIFTNPGTGYNGLMPVGTPLTASLSFASALAPNTNTQLSAEVGGYDFFGGPNQGGVEAYFTQTGANYAVTNDINQYLDPGAPAPLIHLLRYSELTGNVSTDANGNISAWNLNFNLYTNGGGFYIDTVANTINNNGGFVDTALTISSNAATPKVISNVVRLNGVDNTSDFAFNGADTVFTDSGNVQLRSWTQEPGSWQPVNTVPTPDSFVLLLLSTLLSGRLYFKK